MRADVAAQLGCLESKSESVIQALRQLLEDDEEIVRLNAIDSWQRLDSEIQEVENNQILTNVDYELCGVSVQILLQHLKGRDFLPRSNATFALGRLGKTNDSIQPLIIQWIEQHQDSEDVGDAIDALWQIVEG